MSTGPDLASLFEADYAASKDGNVTLQFKAPKQPKAGEGAFQLRQARAGRARQRRQARGWRPACFVDSSSRLDARGGQGS